MTPILMAFCIFDTIFCYPFYFLKVLEPSYSLSMELSRLWYTISLVWWEGETRIYATTATIERKKGAIFLLQNLVTPPPVFHVFVAVVWLKKIIRVDDGSCKASITNELFISLYCGFFVLCFAASCYCCLVVLPYYTSLWIATLQHHPFLYCWRNWKQNFACQAYSWWCCFIEYFLLGLCNFRVELACLLAWIFLAWRIILFLE